MVQRNQAGDTSGKHSTSKGVVVNKASKNEPAIESGMSAAMIDFAAAKKSQPHLKNGEGRSDAGMSSAANTSKPTKKASPSSMVGSVLESGQFAHSISRTIGHVAVVTTVNGDQLQGNVFAVGHHGEVILRDVMLVRDGVTLRKEVIEYVCIEKKDLVELCIRDVATTAPPAPTQTAVDNSSNSSPMSSILPEEDSEDSEAFLPEDLLEDEDETFEKLIEATEVRLSLTREKGERSRAVEKIEEPAARKDVRPPPTVNRPSKEPAIKSAPARRDLGDSRRISAFRTSGNGSAHVEPKRTTTHAEVSGWRGRLPSESKQKAVEPKNVERIWSNSSTPPAPLSCVSRDAKPAEDLTKEVTVGGTKEPSTPSHETINPWSSNADVWHKRRVKQFSISEHDCYSTGYERSANFLNPDAAEFVPKSLEEPTSNNAFYGYPNYRPFPAEGHHVWMTGPVTGPVQNLNMVPQQHQHPQPVFPMAGVPLYIPVETVHGPPGFYQHFPHPASPTGGFLVPVGNQMSLEAYHALMVMHHHQQQQQQLMAHFHPLPPFPTANNSPSISHRQTPVAPTDEQTMTMQDLPTETRVGA